MKAHRRLRPTTVALCCLMAYLPLAGAQAASSSSPQRSPLALGASLGTGGIGVDLAFPIGPTLDLRLGYDFGGISLDHTEDGIDYDADLDFSAARLMVDLRPLGGGFRISAGYYTGVPDVDLEAAGIDDYDIGGRTYIGDLLLLGDLDLGDGAPYLGIGWGGTTGKPGFGMSLDLGVLFTDKPEVGLVVPRGRACDATANPGCDPNGPGSFDVTGNSPEAMVFAAELERERQNLEDDAQDYDLWPILRLGLHYRF